MIRPSPHSGVSAEVTWTAGSNLVVLVGFVWFLWVFVGFALYGQPDQLHPSGLPSLGTSGVWDLRCAQRGYGGALNHEGEDCPDGHGQVVVHRGGSWALGAFGEK